MGAAKRARLEAAGWRFGTVEEFLGEGDMPKKKRAAGANESKWVTTPMAAPDGKPFCDVTYEHRCHSDDIEVAGVTFAPGQIVTYRTRGDVPEVMLEHPELSVYEAAFGVCRIDPMFRYTSLTPFTYGELLAEAASYDAPRARGTIPRFEEAAADGDQPDAEPEGGE